MGVVFFYVGVHLFPLFALSYFFLNTVLTMQYNFIFLIEMDLTIRSIQPDCRSF